MPFRPIYFIHDFMAWSNEAGAFKRLKGKVCILCYMGNANLRDNTQKKIKEKKKRRWWEGEREKETAAFSTSIFRK